VTKKSADDDARFAEIIEREFSQPWEPPAAGPANPATPPRPAPEPFEFNLFDDDESYRQTPPHPGRLSRTALVGLAALAVAATGFLLLLLGVDLPGWLRWAVTACMGVAAGIGIRRLLRRADTDDDNGAVL
jgi:hypothetical protein